MDYRVLETSGVLQQPKPRASPEPTSSQQDWGEHVDSPMRKRPRLDSKPIADKAVPCSRSPLGDSSTEIASTESPTPTCTPQNEQQSPMLPSTSKPPGKVTLDLRSSRSQHRRPSPTYLTELTSGHDAVEQASADHLAHEVHLHQSSTITNSMDLTAESTTSSPGSPPVVEIEVDDAEDINDDSYSMVNIIPNEAERELHLMDGFPFASEHGPVAAAGMLAKAVSGNDHVDIQWLTQTSEWLEEWLNYARSSTSRSRRTYIGDYDFWSNVAQIYNRFLGRKTQFGSLGGRTGDGPRMRIIQRVFAPYIELIDQIVQTEMENIHRMCQEPAVLPDPISVKHLKNLEMMFRPAQDVPLWRLLMHVYHVNVEQIQQTWASNALQHKSQILENLTVLIKLLVHHVDAWPNFGSVLENSGHALRNILLAARSPLRAFESNDRLAYYKVLHPDLLKLVKLIEEQLLQDLDRQTACLSIDLSIAMVKLAIGILYEVAVVEPVMAQKACGFELGGIDEVATTDMPRVLRDCLYFKLLWKFVAKGRMELRVQGVNMISEMLVSLWRDYNVPPKTSPNPIMQLLARLLLKAKVVEYLISVESHPQLITRSRDILGFLFVTQYWSREMTDHFWSTMALLQDRRILAAAMDVHAGILSLSQPPQLLDFVEKLYDLPVFAFGPEVRQFMRTLLSEYALDASSSTHMQTNPLNLCVHILQQTNDHASNTIPEFDVAEIRALAFEMLQKMSMKVPNALERERLYRMCLHEVEDRSKKALGSVDSIIALANVHKSDLELLAMDMDLPRILAQEICAANIAKKASRARMEQPMTNWTPFLKLFTMLVTPCLDICLPSELEANLWDHLIGNEACDDTSRDDAWEYLREIVTNTGGRSNPLVDRFVEQHLPTIPPRLFTLGMFKFVEASIQYVLQIHPPSPSLHEQTIHIPLADLLWRFILHGSSNVITDCAIALLSQYHIETSLIISATTSVMAATHIKLIDRCVSQLEESAKLFALSSSTQDPAHQKREIHGENQDEVEVASCLLTVVDELRFTRTLQFLQKFLSDVKSRPGFCDFVEQRQSPSAEKSSSEGIEGSYFTLKYQSFNAGRQGDIQQLNISDRASFSDLSNKLREVTGFSRISIIYGGKMRDLSATPEQPASELADKGLLLVRNLGVIDLPRLRVSRNSSAAEKAVIAHFDTLYSFLDLPEKLSDPVYRFLSEFPPHPRVMEATISESSSLLELCPSDRRTRTLYSLSSLHKCLIEQLNTGTADERFILHGVRLLSTAITDSSFYMAYLCPPVDPVLASSLVQCLLAFLKERPVRGSVASYLTNEAILVDRLYSLLLIAKDEPVPLLAQESWLVYATIIETTFHSSAAWGAFTSKDDIVETHYWLMTAEATQSTREQVKLCIESTFTGTPTPVAVQPDEYATFYWRMFSTMIPRSAQCPHRSQQLLSTAAAVFSKHAAALADESTLRSHLSSWTELLSRYRNLTAIAQYPDHFVLGVGRLLSVCISFIKSYKKPVSEHRLVKVLFTRFLFPPLTGDERIDCVEESGSPILDDETRKELYNLCLSLSECVDNYGWLTAHTARLLEKELQCEPIGWSADRSRWLRTQIGYAGLKNLTNTCYMNSLVAQLFMNTSFRSFMLDEALKDGSSSTTQQLITETQSLFAHMQNATFKYADTSRFAYAIQPYDNEHIDVTVQMDVDEFYSLLFDRWESQIPSPESKQDFRAFYGGQLITQIKSMDCNHVSEREEPFLAIQCDVKGKSCLAESLKCYVEGDVMEGDNKYKCESCHGRFVNAIKRSCLKNLPDNLIFHLKRFDFDLTTLQRSKINDEFQFPDRIDMTPYQVEHLNDPDGHNQPDIFELVGVLVHNGTAETGHYYSYIRLPRTSEAGPTWGEFNDIEVTEFDPSKIPDQCFGGVWEQPGTDLQFPKNNNAYMLFYQRLTAIPNLHTIDLSNISTGPKKVSIPARLEEDISSANELLIRRYCLCGSPHALFVKSLILSVKNVNGGVCSDSHELEQQVLSMALEYLSLVFAKVKDVPDVDALSLAVRRLCSACGECCAWSLKWIVSRHDVTSAMLLQCPNPKLRTLWGDLIGGNLQELRRHDMQLYGQHLSEDSHDILQPIEKSGCFLDVVDMLLALFPGIGKHLRAWDEYFGLWISIARLGMPELGVLLCQGLFRDCLELLLFDKDERFVTIIQSERNVENIHFLQRTKRTTPLSGLVRLIYTFVIHTNPFHATVNSKVERFHSYDVELQRFPLAEIEQNAILHVDKRMKQMPFISRVMEAMDQEQSSNEWYAGEIISFILMSQPPPLIINRLAISLIMSFGEWLPAFTGFLLRSATYFCRSCPNLEDAIPVVNAAASNAQALGKHAELKRNVLGSASDYTSQGGQDHIAFFRELVYFPNPVCAISSGDINPFELPVIKAGAIWGPPLLLFDERPVRESTVALLDDLIFDHFPEDIDETDPHAFDVARTEVVRQIFERCKSNLMHAERCHVPRPVVRCTMTAMDRCVRWLTLLRDEEDAGFLRRPEDDAIIIRFQEIRKTVEGWRDEEGDGNFSETEWASQFDDDESDDMTEA